MFCITTKLPRDQLFLSIYWSLNLIYHYCLKMRGESPNRFSKVFKIFTTLLYILVGGGLPLPKVLKNLTNIFFSILDCYRRLRL